MCGDATGMSQQQPQLYNSLTAALGPEEQQVIKAALETADKIAAERAVAAANAGAVPGAEAGVQQQQQQVPNGGAS
jgi:importin-7